MIKISVTFYRIHAASCKNSGNRIQRNKRFFVNMKYFACAKFQIHGNRIGVTEVVS